MDKQVGLLICLLGGVGMKVDIIFALTEFGWSMLLTLVCCEIFIQFVFSFFPPPMKIINSVIWKKGEGSQVVITLD